MYEFELIRPDTIANAVEALQGEEAQALGGGQTLIPALKQRLAAPATLVSLTAIEDLQGVRVSDSGAICIGGATTHTDVETGAAGYPALARLAGNIGDPAVRNRGTIGGSLANNDPSACYPAAVLGSGATVVTNTRQIVADGFFKGLFETALDENEIIAEVRFPVPVSASYQRFQQPASRFALVGVFVAKYPDEVRVAVTGASEDGVFRWAEGEAALGAKFTADALDGVEISADGMLGDLHGSADYRAHLVAVLTRRAVTAAQGGQR